MKAVIYVFTIASVSIAISHNFYQDHYDINNIKQHFEKYKEVYNKTYSSTMETFYFDNFKKNLEAYNKYGDKLTKNEREVVIQFSFILLILRCMS